MQWWIPAVWRANEFVLGLWRVGAELGCVKHLSYRPGAFKEANIVTKSAIIFLLKPGGGGGEAAIGFPMATPSFPWEYLSSETRRRSRYIGVL